MPIGDLRVMTWNVRYFSQGTGGLRATVPHLHRVAWAVANAEPLPDVIGLQEIEDGSLRGGSAPQAAAFRVALNAALGANRCERRYDLRYFPAHQYRLRGTALYTTGLALLVRDDLAIEDLPCADVTAFRLPAFARLKQRRIAARIRIRPPGWDRALTVCNTHLSLPAFLEVGPHAVHRRMGHGSNQLVEVDNLLATLDPDQPTIVMGDFNAEPGSPAFERMRAGGWTPAPTDPDVRTAGFLHHRMHLDHLFGSRGLTWSEVRVPDGRAMEQLSDHLPKIGALRPC